MGNILIVCLTAVLWVSLAYADYVYGEFSGDCFTFFDTKVYTEPDSLSGVVSLLPGGSSFQIDSKTAVQTSGNGLETFWYRISFQRDGEILSGYAEGFSFAFTGTLLCPGYVLAAGITGADAETRGCSGEARVISSGIAVASSPLAMPNDPWGTPGRFNYTVETEILEPEGFTGVENIILINFIYEACGYENLTVPLFWTGEDLIQGPAATSVFEAMLFRQAESLQLLSEENQLEVRTILEHWDDSLGSYTLIRENTEGWHWNGTGFTEPD